MECPRCHGALSRHDVYCPHCGLLVEELVASMEPEEESEPPEALGPHAGAVEGADAAGGVDSDAGAVEGADAAGSVDSDAGEDEDADSGAGTGADDGTAAPGTEKTAQNDGAEPSDGDTSANEPAADGEGTGTAEDDSDLDEPSDAEPIDDLDEPDPAEAAGERALGLAEPAGRSHDEFEDDLEPVTGLQLRKRNTASFSALEDTGKIYSPREFVGLDEEKRVPDFFSDLASRVSQTHVSVDLNLRRILIIAGVILVLVVSVSSCVAWSMARGRLEAEQAAQAEADRVLNTALPMRVSLVLPRSDYEHLSPVPLRIRGTRQSGEPFDELRLISFEDPAALLLPGTYTVSLEGPVAADDGIFYRGSVDTFDVVVANEEGQSGDAPAGQTPLFVFEQVEPKDVADTDIEALRNWMAEASLPSAGTYLDAVTGRRKKELDEQYDAQEDKEREERKADEEAARTIEERLNASKKTSNSYFAFNIPSSWQGKVDVTNKNDAEGIPVVTVHLPGNESAELVRVSYASGVSVANAGGLDQHVVVSRVSSDGKHHVEVRTTNWPYVASQGSAAYYANVTDDELDQLVQLSSGGELSLSDVQQGGYGDSLVDAERHFSETAFGSVVAY